MALGNLGFSVLQVSSSVKRSTVPIQSERSPRINVLIFLGLSVGGGMGDGGGRKQ